MLTGRTQYVERASASHSGTSTKREQLGASSQRCRPFCSRNRFVLFQWTIHECARRLERQVHECRAKPVKDHFSKSNHQGESLRQLLSTRRGQVRAHKLRRPSSTKAPIQRFRAVPSGATPYPDAKQRASWMQRSCQTALPEKEMQSL